jgi:hypothetical protein
MLAGNVASRASQPRRSHSFVPAVEVIVERHLNYSLTTVV